MLMAGLDGIKDKIEPLSPVDKDLYELPPDELASVPQVRVRSPRCSTPWRRTTTTCSRVASSRRPHRDVDRVQADR